MKDDNDNNQNYYPQDSEEVKEENTPKNSINQDFQQNEEENNNKNNNEKTKEIEYNDNKENSINEEISNKDEDNNIPNRQNNENNNNINQNSLFDSLNNSIKNSNIQKEEDFNDNLNNDNNIKEERNIVQNNNNETFRFSSINNSIENKRYSNINDEDDYNKNNYDNENINDNFENQDNKDKNNNYDNEINKYNADNEKEENNKDKNNNNENKENNNVGFRESDLKDNSNINPYENYFLGNSANSEHPMNEYNNINQENNNLGNTPNNNINIIYCSNNNNNNNTYNTNNNNYNYSNNNIYNKNNINDNNNKNNNNINYATNPYISNPYITKHNNDNNNIYNSTNNNKNGIGLGTSSYNINQTTSNFMPQENHNVVNNLNNMYTSNDNINFHQHPDYNIYWEHFEENPEDNDGFNIFPNKQGKNSSKSAGFQIINILMGAGFLSIPIIMSYLGFLLSIIFIAFFVISTFYSVHILIRCYEITGKNSYSMLGKITMGLCGSIFVKIIIIINNLGLCVCYLRIFGEALQTIIQVIVSPNSVLATNWHNFIYILIGSIIMFILIFIKKIVSLKKFAFLGIFPVLVFITASLILLLYKTFSNKLDSNIGWDFLFPNASYEEILQVFPSLFLVFLFQFNAFPIFFSLKKRNMETMYKATKTGIEYSLILFLIIGVTGFLLYGHRIEDTILDNLNDDMILYRRKNILIIILIIIICISFIIMSLINFPSLFLSLRVNYINSLIICFKSCKKNESSIVDVSQGKFQKEENEENIINKKALMFIAIILFVFILICSIVIYKIKTMLIFIGAFSGIFISFILPNLFYIIIIKKSGYDYSVVLPFIFFGIGVFFLFSSIMISIF